jgi:hypothetical protein
MAQLGQRKLKYQRPGLYWHALHETVKVEAGEEAQYGALG